MDNQDTYSHSSVSWEGGSSGVVAPQALVDDWTPAPDAPATAFSTAIDGTLHLTAELARRLIGAHQAAASLIVKGNWQGMRKYFSLSPKYAAWYSYRTPAVGFGIHADIVNHNSAIRLTQAELEQHPDFKRFGREAGKHPPMRGWLAVPLIGEDGRNYGLLQLSDKYNDADFTEADEAQLKQLAQLTSKTLAALYRLHDNQPPAPRQ
ncbi:MAG TPA: GAF domain-containing protein [Ktedonobacteraceae bacterium]|nr:GAF domain-containing protein [Ktedonobacteraceae bacterium]